MKHPCLCACFSNAHALEQAKLRSVLAGNNPDWVTDSVPHGQHASNINQDLPDHVMVALLEREKLLTQGKAHVSSFEAMMGERELRHLQAMIRQVHTQPRSPLATKRS